MRTILITLAILVLLRPDLPDLATSKLSPVGMTRLITSPEIRRRFRAFWFMKILGVPSPGAILLRPPGQQLKWFKLLLIGDLPHHPKTSNELHDYLHHYETLSHGHQGECQGRWYEAPPAHIFHSPYLYFPGGVCRAVLFDHRF